MNTTKLYSSRDLARWAGVPFHVMRYVLAESGIEPAARLGIVRVYTQDQLPAIREALDKSSRRELAGAVASA